MLQFFCEIGLRNADWSLLFVHVMITLPFVMRTLLASMGAFDFSLVDAARMLDLSHAWFTSDWFYYHENPWYCASRGR